MKLRKALDWLRHHGKQKGLAEPLPEQSTYIYDAVDEALGLKPGTAEMKAFVEGRVSIEKDADGLKLWPHQQETQRAMQKRFEPFPPEPEQSKEFKKLCDETVKAFERKLMVPLDVIHGGDTGPYPIRMRPHNALELGTMVHMMIERSFDRHSRRVYNRLHHPDTRVARGQKRFNGRMVRLDCRSGYRV